MTNNLQEETSVAASRNRAPAGGGFLIESCEPVAVFTPEDFTEQHLLLAQTMDRFMRDEVLPRSDEIERQEPGLIPRLLRQAGGLGLLSIDVPERHGGTEMDMASTIVVAERTGQQASFAVAFGGQAGIGLLPLVFFGNEDQQRSYLPRMAAGDLLSAYCLSEADSGSDALAARTRATLSVNGRHYVLNGEKMWVTSAGYADFFNVFAKVDGEKFSCFLVERNFPGLSTGAEEKKMGIKGSSTRSLILDDVPVPVANLLGEVGRAHAVALNILNVGRLRLAATCVGGAKASMQNSIAYAKRRRAFGKSIAEFGLIQEKLAEMAVRIFAAESVLYRTTGLIDAAIEEMPNADGSWSAVRLHAVERYAIECSINKVFASEMLDYVVDEAVQIHGGYGYHQDYPAERAYRDARINRIFEGTNEINHLVIADLLVKRALRGHLPWMDAAAAAIKEAETVAPAASAAGYFLATEKSLAAAAKKRALLIAAWAYEKYSDSLGEQQEIVAAISDMVIDAFAMESAVLRAEKMSARFGANSERTVHAGQLAQALVHSRMDSAEGRARVALAAICSGEERRSRELILRKIAERKLIDSIGLRRTIASCILRQEKYSI